MRKYRPYNAGQIDYRVKLDANESPYDLPDNVKKALVGYIMENSDIMRYPDDNAYHLKNDIAQHYNVNLDNIIIGNGSDQIIDLISRIFINPGDTIICPSPSFGMYAASAVMMDGNVSEVKLLKEEDFKYNPERIISRARECEPEPKLVYLCTPNNPTGGLMKIEDVIHVINTLSDSIVVIDEAYAEFSGISFIPEVIKYENAIVLRTFSKAYGLAGLRIGYSIANENLTKIIGRAKPPYNTGSLAQVTARLMLKEREHIESCIAKIKDNRDYLSARLMCDGVKVFDSSANFVLADLSNLPGMKNMKQKEHSELGLAVADNLASKGILVRAFGDPELADCIRITAGTRQQMEEFMNAFEDAIDVLETGML